MALRIRSGVIAATTQVTPVKLIIIVIFHNIMAHYKRTYCWPTRATMRTMIYKKTGRWYSLSWIDECLYWLNQNKFIVSYFRPGRNADGTLFNRPSNRQLTRKALGLMRKMGISVKDFLWGVTKRLFPPQDKTTATRQKPPDPPEKPQRRAGKHAFEDPASRKKMGLKPDPPFKPEAT